MKKLVIMLVAFLGIAATASAQGGGFNRRTPEERAAQIHAKLDSAFKIEASKLATLDTALVVLYKAQDKKREEFMAGGTPDRETMMAEMKKFNDSRDEMLKAVLTADQFATWKEKIEPSMRPQRPQGGGGNRR
jgi:periplasmic protein CpxP/Spy